MEIAELAGGSFDNFRNFLLAWRLISYGEEINLDSLFGICALLNETAGVIVNDKTHIDFLYFQCISLKSNLNMLAEIDGILEVPKEIQDLKDR